MPSHSRMVAHVKPAWPFAAWRCASAVHLWAFTCGRSFGPGSAADIVDRLCSKAALSTSRAGVCSSPTRIVRTVAHVGLFGTGRVVELVYTLALGASASA